MNKVIALVGMCGAGKFIAADFYKELGYESVYFGGATMEELNRRGLDVNEVNEKFVREDLRKIHGMGAFAVLKMPEIMAALKKGNVIIDGLYSWSEYKVLKEKLGDSLVVLAIYTSRKLRYQRLAIRPIRPLTPEQAYGRDTAEIENIEKGGPIAIADYLLVDDGSIEDLKRHLGQLNL